MIAIAIDGPGGAGKTTISKEIAKRLGIVYVDTGALYRTVGFYAKECGLSVEDSKKSEKIVPLLSDIRVDINYYGGTQHVLLNGQDLGDRIREPEISMYASAVSSVSEVRDFLLDTQRNIAENNDVIMDGRDIGTVIIPDAEVKIFLTASDEARAKRRYKELREKGMDVDYEQVLSELIERDLADSQRDIAPCKPAKDAVVIDNSDFSLEESIAAILKTVEDKTGVRALERQDV